MQHSRIDNNTMSFSKISTAITLCLISLLVSSCNLRPDQKTWEISLTKGVIVHDPKTERPHAPPMRMIETPTGPVALPVTALPTRTGVAKRMEGPPPAYYARQVHRGMTTVMIVWKNSATDNIHHEMSMLSFNELCKELQREGHRIEVLP